MPLATFPGRHGWGYDGVDLYAPLPAYGTPRGAGALRRCMPRARSRRAARCRVQPLGSGRQLSELLRSVFHRSREDRVGRGDQLRRRAQRRGAPLRHRQCARCGCATTDSTDCGSTRCTPSSASRRRTYSRSWRRRCAGWASELDRSFVLIAESDLNDPRLVHSAGARRLRPCRRIGPMISTTPSIATSPERRPGYYADFHGLEDIATALREGYVYQGQYSKFRQRRHGRAPRGVARRPTRRVRAESRSNRQPRARRAPEHAARRRRAQGDRRADAVIAVRAAAVPGRGVGRDDAVPLLHRPPGPGTWAAWSPRAGPGNSASFRWAGEVPNPQAPRTFERSKLDWSELSKPRTRRTLRLAPPPDRVASR